MAGEIQSLKYILLSRVFLDLRNAREEKKRIAEWSVF